MDEATESPEKSLSNARIGGLEVNYYVLCPRKLWWYSHGLGQETANEGAGAQSVTLGTLTHETTFAERTRKDVMIDDLIRLDFTQSGEVQEVKKSRGGQRAGLFQLLYYLYYLKHEKGIVTKGVLEYPKERRRQEVELTPELEQEVVAIIEGVGEVRAMAQPPFVAEPMPICKKCAYQDLCWG